MPKISLQRDPQDSFYSGYVSILGRPNAGKSTLLNALLDEQLSIQTPKAQTTRHRIKGIETGENYQMIFSDTPGIMNPAYPLQQAMMNYVRESLQDADVLVMVVDGQENEELKEQWFPILRDHQAPLFLVVNKVDQLGEEKAGALAEELAPQLEPKELLLLSAEKGQGVEALKQAIGSMLPEHPAYFPQDSLSDRSERFYASEMIRAAILENYKQEIPYSVEVVVTAFKESKELIKIFSDIYVERKSQKGILIGKGGKAMKRMGQSARKKLQRFFGKKVYLETYIRVEPDWRSKSKKLKSFGYGN